jgi:lysophospholipase L1-like esterase
LLTIEFNDSVPKVAAIEILPNKKATTIFLAGNSTVVDQDREPWAAWGQMFPRFLVPSKVAVANYAESGETLLAFKGEGRLQKIWSLAQPGDYLFIEFAHNDQKSGSSHLDAFTTYKQTLKEWIVEAKKRKVVPVLVTSMHRRNFDSVGHIINTLLDYPEAMRQVAKEEDVQLLDLNAMSKLLYEAWGVEGSLKAFVHYPANSFPGQTNALKDNTHFSPYGAYELAKCIVTGVRSAGLPLVAFLKKEWRKYDPSEPLPFDKFYWPPSSFRELTKPSAN